MPTPEPVLIAGGGPVGLVAAYALGQQGIPVIVFDDNDELQLDPRAATTHPATLELLDELGIIQEVIANGLVFPPSGSGTAPPVKLSPNSTMACSRTTPPIPMWCSANSSSCPASWSTA